MIFNSLTYFVLLFTVVVLYWTLPYRARLLLILAASLTFYGFWRIEFIPVMLVSIVVDYFVALQMPEAKHQQKLKLLIISLIVNLGLLFYFKYLIFFADNAVGFANLLGADVDPLVMDIILPLGISFYTFQTISYSVDVYRGSIKPEKDFVLYACYVTFFPQLVAGPVLRAAEVLHQFAHRIPFRWHDIVVGLRRVFYGLFLKVVLADNIAPFVDAGYSMPVDTISAIDVWTLAFLFGFQIYFDFCAYSHIALGSARMMGIRFPENFNFPYVATSPKDFWGRWHISLSSWVRDYLYFPLAGIKVQDSSVGGLSAATSEGKKTKSLYLTWAMMGLWHGANWTFILWGIYHSIIIFLYRILLPVIKLLNIKIRIYGGILVTLLLMMLAWIPFRADSLENTFAMWSKVVNLSEYFSMSMRENTYLVAALMTIGMLMTYWVKEKLHPAIKNNTVLNIAVESIFFSIIMSLIIIYLRPINQFIYFQF